jgi:hypothetical protein
MLVAGSLSIALVHFGRFLSEYGFPRWAYDVRSTTWLPCKLSSQALA